MMRRFRHVDPAYKGTSVKQLILLTVVLSMLTACGGADEPDTTAVEPTTAPGQTTEPTATEQASGLASEPASEPVSETPEPDVTVTAVDYAYEDIPDPIPAGSVLGLDNRGAEPHELVAVHIPASETRSIEELLALPEDEEPPVEFMGVVVTTTDGQTFYPEGPVTLEEPGRYAFVCFLPQGITDEAIMQAAQETAPGEEPSFPEGPPHFTLGMWSEVTVE